MGSVSEPVPRYAALVVLPKSLRTTPCGSKHSTSEPGSALRVLRVIFAPGACARQCLQYLRKQPRQRATDASASGHLQTLAVQQTAPVFTSSARAARAGQ